MRHLEISHIETFQLIAMVQEQDIQIESEVNRLFPVFPELEQLRLLIVGGGELRSKNYCCIDNSPQTKIKVVGITVKEEIKKLSSLHSNAHRL